MLKAVFLVFSSSLLCAVLVSAGSLSPTQCLDRGFSPDHLPCPNCRDLKQFKLGELEETCQQCCTQTDNEEEPRLKYHRAVLTVCTCKFGRYPQIEAFVRSDRPKRFPNFTFKHVPAAEPVLHLYDDKDEKVQSLGVEKWDTDTLTSFLEEKLAT